MVKTRLFKEIYKILQEEYYLLHITKTIFEMKNIPLNLFIPMSYQYVDAELNINHQFP